MRSWLFLFQSLPPPKVSEMIFPGCDREREGGVKAKAWNWMLWHLAFNTSLAPSQHLVEDKCLKLKLEHRTLRKWNIHSGHPLCCVFVFRFFESGFHYITHTDLELVIPSPHLWSTVIHYVCSYHQWLWLSHSVGVYWMPLLPLTVLGADGESVII